MATVQPPVPLMPAPSAQSVVAQSSIGSDVAQPVIAIRTDLSEWRSKFARRSRSKQRCALDGLAATLTSPGSTESLGGDAVVEGFQFECARAAPNNIQDAVVMTGGRSTRSLRFCRLAESSNSSRKRSNTGSGRSTPGSEQTHVNLHFESPLWDCAWRGSRLLCSSDHGRVFLFDMPASQGLPAELPTPVEYVHAKLTKPTREVPEPRRLPPTHRVSRVAINNLDYHVFLTLENQNFHLWNFENTKAPTLSKRLSSSHNHACQWNPHTPHEFVVASRSLKLVDQRILDGSSSTSGDRPVVWKVNDAHRDVVNDVAFNPFVPYFIATGGDDGEIRIWDTRFGTSPVATLGDHFDGVSTIAWSPLHMATLASGGRDRHLRLWTLTAPPHYTLGNIAHMDDTIAHVSWLETDARRCVAVSHGEQLCVAELTPKFVRTSVQSRFAQSDRKEKAIEQAFLLRTVKDTTVSDAIALAKMHKGEGKFQLAERIIDLCIPREAFRYDGYAHSDHSSSGGGLAVSLATGANINKRDYSFEATLEQFTRFVPPRLPEMYRPNISSETLTMLKQMRTTLRLETMVNEGNFDHVLDLASDLCEIVKSDFESVKPALLQRVLCAALSEDFAIGVRFGIQVIQTIGEKVDNLNEFVGGVHMLMYPTLYDPVPSDWSRDAQLLGVPDPSAFALVYDSPHEPEALVTPPELADMLKNKQRVSTQLILLDEVLAELNTPDECDLVRLLRRVNFAIIPMFVQRHFWRALVHQQRFAELFSLLEVTLGEVKGRPFESYVSATKDALTALASSVLMRPLPYDDERYARSQRQLHYLTMLAGLVAVHSTVDLGEDLIERIVVNIGHVAGDLAPFLARLAQESDGVERAKSVAVSFGEAWASGLGESEVGKGAYVSADIVTKATALREIMQNFE